MGRHPWQRWKSPPCCLTLLEAVKERSRQALPQPPPRALAASRSTDCGEARQGRASNPWDASSTSCGTVPGHAGRALHIPCRTPAPAGQAPSSKLPKPSQARSPEPTVLPPPGRVGAGGEKPAWPCSSVPATHSNCRRFCTRGTTGTVRSFSEKVLMLSCIQKTEQPATGPLSWGLWSAARDGAEREGTSFPIPMLCFPTFSLTPVQRQKMKSCVPPPHQSEFFGTEFSFQLRRGRGRRRWCRQGKWQERHSPFSMAAHGQSGSHPLRHCFFRCRLQGSLAPSSKKS